MKLENIKEKFLSYLLVVKRASVHTIRNYELDIQSFISFITIEGAAPRLEDLHRHNLRRFLSHESLRSLSARSLARRLSSLRSLCTFCCKEKLLSSNPMERIDSPKLDRRLPVFLSYQQVERFLQLPDTSTVLGLRDRAIMELFYSSGLRVSELVGMNLEDIDSEESLVMIRGKGKKERIIPITPNALQWLTTYCRHPGRCYTPLQGKREPVFLNSRGGRLTTRSVDRMCKHYLTISGFSDRITPHVIRHTIATHWLENGMDLKTIQALLGHSSMETTTIYTKVSGTLKKKVITDLHPRA